MKDGEILLLNRNFVASSLSMLCFAKNTFLTCRSLDLT